MLKVTNTHNNKSVVVRVNDRGPFVSARIIDLSQGAAERLDMITTGTAPVKVESVEAIALPSSNGRTARPPAGEILTPPATPLAGASPASRPAAGGQDAVRDLAAPVVAAQSRSSAAVPSAPAAVPVPETVSVPETAAPVVANAFTGPSVQSPERAAPIRQTTADPAAWSPVQQIAAQPQVQPIPAATLPPAEIKPAIPPAGTGKSYRIQVGAYKVPRYAVDAFDRLKTAGLSPAYERSGDVYRVVLAGIRAEDVESIAGTLGNAGFPEAMIREE
jgi:rare lipoprotein A